MMAQKLLHELLEEDQEPFILKNYIADRRCQLKKPSPKTHLQINKRKLISPNSNFPSNFCKKACFLSTHDSPDLKKSPLFEPKRPNTIFLLDAALRIQQQSSSKTKSRNKSSNGTGFGLFGSILKKLTHRNKIPERETVNSGSKVSVKDILRWDSTLGKINGISEEKNEEKSMDSEEISMSNGVLEYNSAFDSFDKHFSQSPFHFVLQTTPSPSRREREEKENYESLKRLKLEEEEEQCSPVSVLDCPFEDDDRHVDADDDEDDDGDNGMDRFDLECTYAIVQRAKQQFLQKLCRFEKLAELDPIELEKRILGQERHDDDDAESSSSESEMKIDDYNLKHIPDCMKRLVSDLIAEEETAKCNGSTDKLAAMERVCKRLDSWKDVQSNTIDMMVEQDFRRDQIEGWKGNEEQIRETAIEVELAIFGLLMQELSDELVFLTGV
ncbi:uncharacterized protein LOC120153896 [Hibiscus syriacus]|uniref:uncharacterized protein LOC120153896 n=1 Tax=Hibiscus syriacus TaxID=106335 RepID=UPI001924A09E|nr:uncharacterized protein LOC120153896 [Hibiscus syriacus]